MALASRHARTTWEDQSWPVHVAVGGFVSGCIALACGLVTSEGRGVVFPSRSLPYADAGKGIHLMSQKTTAVFHLRWRCEEP